MAKGWRERWASRENSRRMAEYQQSLRRWQYDNDLIRHYLELAHAPDPRVAVAGLRLRKHEHVLWSAEALMIEAPDVISLFQPVHAVYSPTRTTGAYLPITQAAGSLRDKGFAAVTNERVIFVGSGKNREWSFANLTGIAHGAQAPVSLLRVSNRQKISGLVLSNETAAGFQFFLSLALAGYRHERDDFVAHLRQLYEYHQTLRPPVPHAVGPHLAPHPIGQGLRAWSRLYFGGPGASTARRITPALATAMVALCMCVALAPTPDDPTGPPLDDTRAAVGQAQPRTVVTSAPPAVSPLTPSPAPAATSAPAPTTPAPAAPTPPKAAPTTGKPKPVNLCGAPRNPWGYNFCGGGGTISDPPGDFCNYFDCIKSFWENTNGYVIQCEDGMFSHSGGRRGSCSYHGGNWRTLRP